MAYGPMKRGPQTDNPKDRQFKIRLTQSELNWISETAKERGITKTAVIRDRLGLEELHSPKVPTPMTEVDSDHSVTIGAAISPQQREWIAAAAKARGLTLSEWMRECLFSPKMTVVPGEQTQEKPREPDDGDIDRLAKQIYGREGIPMAAARRKARQQLSA